MGKVSWTESKACRTLPCAEDPYYKGGGTLPEKATSKRGKRRASKREGN